MDENVPAALGKSLKSCGVDVTTTIDAGLLHADDSEHLSFASGTQRVIVTLDTDFSRIAAEGIEHNGIVFLLPKKRSLGDIVAELTRIGSSRTTKDMHNWVEFV